MKYKAPLVART